MHEKAILMNFDFPIGTDLQTKRVHSSRGGILTVNTWTFIIKAFFEQGNENIKDYSRNITGLKGNFFQGPC